MTGKVPKGKKCNVGGCCLFNPNFCQPESPSAYKPDARFPRLWQDICATFYFIPFGFYMFLKDVYNHTVKATPRRPTWTIDVTLAIGVRRLLKDAFINASLGFWRRMFALPFYFLDYSNFYPSSFLSRKYNLPGLLSELDKHESGLRSIQADWILADSDKQDKIVLYFHGGGFIGKDWGAFTALATGFVKYTKRNVFAVSYSVAPETRFPGAIYDGIQAYFHLIEHYHIKPENITIAGDSAGGGLAFSLLIYLRDHQYPLPEASVLLSPWLDMTYEFDSWITADVFDYLPKRPEMNQPINPARFYLGPDHYERLKRHPYASPLFVDHLRNLPPILVVSGSHETMTDENRALEKRFKEECKTAIFKYDEHQDMVHDFLSIPEIKSTQLAYESIQKWLLSLHDLEKC